jgi:hypothetical protein
VSGAIKSLFIIELTAKSAQDHFQQRLIVVLTKNILNSQLRSRKFLNGSYHFNKVPCKLFHELLPVTTKYCCSNKTENHTNHHLIWNSQNLFHNSGWIHVHLIKDHCIFDKKALPIHHRTLNYWKFTKESLQIQQIILFLEHKGHF